MGYSQEIAQTVSPWQAYRLRLVRRRMLWRSFRSRHQLNNVTRRLDGIQSAGVLAFTVLRNEAARLPFFLKHYRDLGVSHFLMVDNGSDDGSVEFLTDQKDVSLWQTSASYRASRFGLDWLTWLQMRYASGRWSLMVDADELLVYRDDDRVTLPGLTSWMDQKGQTAFGALMLDLYPKGALGGQTYAPGQDPRKVLNWFDPSPYRAIRQMPRQNLWVQGGVRERVFFTDQPERSPTLNKIPLVKWHRSYAYINSCHSILPAQINHSYDGPGGMRPSGALLHTKFLPEIVAKSETEKARKEHFNVPEDFDHYYDRIGGQPDLWTQASVRYQGPQQLADLNLITPGDW